MTKQICFILDWYPTQTNNGCVFAKHLICAIADMGFECVVIAPRIKNANTEKVPYKRVEKTDMGSVIKIYTPTYFHLTSRKQTIKMSMNNHFKAVMKTIKKENIKPDVVYGHFIYQCGLTAARVGEKFNIPSYCACGENSTRFEKGSQPYTTGITYANWKDTLKKLKGIISVSSNNKNLLIDNGYVEADKNIGVFPNGVDESKFNIKNKQKCREQLSFPKDAFITVFTGAFSERKGIVELNSALRNCDNVYSVFLGKGPIEPDCDNILFKGSVTNDMVATYLNAADVFVLPTKGEGCCNAIVEALACGLPVISSDLPFNDDILNDGNSIRVDVTDVTQIEKAIKCLRDDKAFYERLQKGALESADKLSIKTRASNILKFMGLI